MSIAYFHIRSPRRGQIHPIATVALEDLGEKIRVGVAVTKGKDVCEKRLGAIKAVGRLNSQSSVLIQKDATKDFSTFALAAGLDKVIVKHHGDAFLSTPRNFTALQGCLTEVYRKDQEHG